MADDLVYETAENEFMIALSAANFETAAPVSDPRYVRWYATTIDAKDGQTTYTWYPMHQCSDDEVSRFYSPSSN